MRLLRNDPNSIVTLVFAAFRVHWNHGIALLSQLLVDSDLPHTIMMLEMDKPVSPNWLPLIDSPFVGFSAVTGWEYQWLLPIIQRVKSAGHITLVGGTWAGLNHPVPNTVDYICRGDGEGLVDFLLTGDESVWEGSPVHPDLDTLPIPNYDLFADIPFDRGLPMPMPNSTRLLPYVSSRGCPFHCRFCQARLQPKYRYRSQVESDLTHLTSTYSPTHIVFGDAQLPYHIPSWRDSWGDFHFPFISYIRPDIPPAQLEWLIQRGLCVASFGIESGSEAFRAQILGKPVTDVEIARTIDILVANGIQFVASFMVGVPYEPWEVQTATAKAMEWVKSKGGYPMSWRYEHLG